MKATPKRYVAASILALAAIGTSGCAQSPAPQAAAGTGMTAVTASNRSVTVYLTRHGETMLNALGRAQGWSDSPLTEEGREIATAVGKGLKKKVGTVDAVYSADMVRHFETASLMAKQISPRLEVTRDRRLRELAFGGFEGGPGKDLFAAAARQLNVGSMDELLMNYTLPEITDAIAAANPNPELPAEGCSVAGPRMQESLDEIARKATRSGQTKVLAVSSGMSISCVIDELGGTLPDGPIENGAVNELQYRNGTWTVKSVNDTSYAH
ncbi:histidine phosphatase family protein [Paeniglutamicibacter sp. R2-26]|uniref:histidine phosphatase family protein n=1 Tax=Paeniglutamicibacter sp. R2-26 TaxID=3144417 RepID=UPI003EE57FAF